MTTQSELLNALRELHAAGVKRVRANTIAEKLWPNGRSQNARGQVFPLSAGVAGRMLRKCVAVREVTPREWEILVHRIN